MTFYLGYLAYLRDKGWSVLVTAESSGLLEKLGRDEGVSARHLGMRRDPSPLHDLVSLARAVGMLRQARPDAVVAATPKAALIGMIAAWMTRVPVRVYQMWGLRFESERGLKKLVLVQLEKVTAFCATQVVANSMSLAEAAKGYGIAQDIVVLGPGSSHGVDIDYFTPAGSNLSELDDDTETFLREEPDLVCVGFIGRITGDKGIVTLLEALQICRAEGVRFNVLMIGSSEDRQLESRVKEASKVLRIKRVQARSDLRPYYSAMDIHCLPTFREGFPNVVLEAAAMGICTITTLATGARDSVIDGETGMLVAPGDAQALAVALKSLGNGVDIRERYGRAASARARDVFRRELIWELQESNLTDQVRLGLDR